MQIGSKKAEPVTFIRLRCIGATYQKLFPNDNWYHFIKSHHLYIHIYNFRRSIVNNIASGGKRTKVLLEYDQLLWGDAEANSVGFNAKDFNPGLFPVEKVEFPFEFPLVRKEGVGKEGLPSSYEVLDLNFIVLEQSYPD